MQVKLATICLTICCVIWLNVNLIAQNAYHDALSLKTKLTIDNKVRYSNDTALSLLFNYLPDHLKKRFNNLPQNDLRDSVKSHYDQQNPFIKISGKGENIQAFSLKTLAATISSAGNFNVTNLADGLAKFLVKRTKEELSAAFFEQFKEDMNDTAFSGLRILFPQTARLLNLIDEKIYQFSAYLTELREAFILDLNSLPSSVLIVVNLPKYKPYFSRHPELKSALQSGLFIADLLLMKDSLRHIGNVLDSMPVDSYFSLSNKRKFDSVVNGCLKTARLISNSLRSLDTTGQSTNTQRYWVSVDSLFMLFNDPVTLKIYLGLLYQQAKTEDISFLSNKKLADIFINTAGFIDGIQNVITTFYAGLNAFDNFKEEFGKIQMGLQDDSLRKVYYYGMFSSSISILESGLGLVDQLKPGFADSGDSIIAKIVPPIKDAGDIYMYVNQKKYGPAVLSLVKLYEDIFKEASKREKKDFNLTKLILHLGTYGTFISEVAKAENSDQVADIIEKTVLPTGSSYIKKHSIFNISLQAYTGLYGGQQRQATDKGFVTTAGVYAPLGVAASWGSRTMNKAGNKRNPYSFSFFLSVIDLGPLVSYRFSNASDSLANDINIRLNQILSPGIHVVYGFPKLPISFGIGGNWTPLLTKVETHAIHVLDIDKRPFRWQAFLAVDIPFFNFYNKPR